MPRAFSLTDKDQEVFDYLVGQINQNGYAPSVRELAEHFNVASLSTIQARLYRLKRHGLIQRVGARAIRITNE